VSLEIVTASDPGAENSQILLSGCARLQGLKMAPEGITEADVKHLGSTEITGEYRNLHDTNTEMKKCTKS
jgi:hypothetical protein